MGADGRTPRPWPEDVVPTAEQLADWLEIATREERERLVAGLIESAEVANRCLVQGHDGLLSEVAHAGNLLIRCPACAIDQMPRADGSCRTQGCDYSRVVAALDALPEAVRTERGRRGLSLRTAAAQVGIDFNSLTRLEKGRNSTLAHIRAATAWLSTPPGQQGGGDPS